MTTSSSPQDQIILFTRYPEAGSVKTRLIPKLGKQGAALLHRSLSERIIERLSTGLSGTKQLAIHYTGAGKERMEQWLGDALPLVKQQGDDLGSRMERAFLDAKAHGFQRTILIGSDCPAVDPDLTDLAFDRLSDHDVVIGPTFDGGYYLIGLSGALPREKIALLFSNISWGTDSVYRQTILNSENGRMSVFALPRHHDIDRPQDLEYLDYHPHP